MIASKYIAISLIIILLIYSCDTSKPKPSIPCGNVDIPNCLFLGFSLDELDTIFIKKFNQGFHEVPVESYSEIRNNIVQNKLENYFDVDFKRKLNTNFDYEITINGYKFFFTDFKVDWKVHATQFDKPYFCELISYKINDSLIKAGNCIIEKRIKKTN